MNFVPVYVSARCVEIEFHVRIDVQLTYVGVQKKAQNAHFCCTKSFFGCGSFLVRVSGQCVVQFILLWLSSLGVRFFLVAHNGIARFLSDDSQWNKRTVQISNFLVRRCEMIPEKKPQSEALPSNFRVISGQ